MKRSASGDPNANAEDLTAELPVDLEIRSRIPQRHC